MTVVLVHGFPETAAIWRPFEDALDGDAVAVSLPGFGAVRPDGFTGTKDALAEWLAETLERVEPPVDVVGTRRRSVIDDAGCHGLRGPAAELGGRRPGNLPSRPRLARAGSDDGAARHRRSPEHLRPPRRGRRPRRPGRRDRRSSRRDDEPQHFRLLPLRDAERGCRLVAGRRPYPVARTRPAPAHPPEIEAMAVAVAERLGAETARLDDLNHCWMAEAPERVAPVLERFWSALE